MYVPSPQIRTATPDIVLRRVEHRGQTRLGLYFRYERQPNDEVRQVPEPGGVAHCAACLKRRLDLYRIFGKVHSPWLL